MNQQYSRAQYIWKPNLRFNKFTFNVLTSYLDSSLLSLMLSISLEIDGLSLYLIINIINSLDYKLAPLRLATKAKVVFVFKCTNKNLFL